VSKLKVALSPSQKAYCVYPSVGLSNITEGTPCLTWK